MIRVRKPKSPPTELVARGVPLRDTMLSQARQGAADFDFDAKGYGHAAVKSALIAAQHGKCAFCESRFTHVAYGDVEPFRPKAAVEADGRLVRPGYFWLAYEWSNLYASCSICNQRHKRNAFPVRDERATYDQPGLVRERPLLLDPGHGNPERHIEFVGSVPHGRTERGRTTIRDLGLEREPLNLVRRDRFMTVEKYLRILVQLGGDSDRDSVDLFNDTVRELCGWMRDDAEFAAMSRCAVSTHSLGPRVFAACI